MRARNQFIESMTYTIIEDVEERLKWRFEAISATEMVGIMKTREKRAYHLGFDAGRAARKHRIIGAILGTLAKSLECIGTHCNDGFRLVVKLCFKAKSLLRKE
jgi:hypothetical protein